MNDNNRRVVGWVALLAAPLGLFNVYCYMMAVGGDTEAMFKPAVALTLSEASQHWFMTAMVADSFSFYLPFLLIGAFVWAQLRPRGGSQNDAAALALTVYVLLGIAGTSMQFAALPALAKAHAAGDAMVRAASESAWLALVTATERGLWWIEGPLMAYWGWVTGRALQREGWGAGRMLMGAGVLYAVIFLWELFGGGKQGEELLLIVLTVLVPLWLVMFGVGLLRGKFGPVQA